MSQIDAIFIYGTMAMVGGVALMLMMWRQQGSHKNYLVEGIAWGLVSTLVMYFVMGIEESICPFMDRYFVPEETKLFGKISFFSPGNALLAAAFLLGLIQRAVGDPRDGAVVPGMIVYVFGTFFLFVGLIAGTWDLARYAFWAILYVTIIGYGHLLVFPARKSVE